MTDDPRFLDAVLFGLTDAVAAVDAGGAVRSVNRAFEELLGVKEADAIGKPLTTFDTAKLQVSTTKTRDGAVVVLRRADQGRPLDELTDRQRETLDALLEGLSEKQIAARFDRSQHTVHDHVKALYRRFGVQSRAELLALFIGPRPAGRRAGR